MILAFGFDYTGFILRVRGSSSSTVTVDADFYTKDFQKNLTRRPNYNRRGFERKEETLEQIKREYTSDIIKTLKANGNEYTWRDVTVKLVESYGTGGLRVLSRLLMKQKK